MSYFVWKKILFFQFQNARLKEKQNYRIYVITSIQLCEVDRNEIFAYDLKWSDAMWIRFELHKVARWRFFFYYLLILLSLFLRYCWLGLVKALVVHLIWVSRLNRLESEYEIHNSWWKPVCQSSFSPYI